MIHLDTNFLIDAIESGSVAHGRFHTWAQAGESFGISTVAWAEFLCGPLDAVAEQLARQICPHTESLTIAAAELAAVLFNKTGRRSRSLADCMIAATAIRSGAALATLNTSDFALFIPHGLRLT